MGRGAQTPACAGPPCHSGFSVQVGPLKSVSVTPNTASQTTEFAR
jgi:hypothetical protein